MIGQIDAGHISTVVELARYERLFRIFTTRGNKKRYSRLRWIRTLAALSQAQAAGQVSEIFPPAFLLTTMMALFVAWSVASPFGAFCDGVPADDIRNMLQRMIGRMIRSE